MKKEQILEKALVKEVIRVTRETSSTDDLRDSRGLLPFCTNCGCFHIEGSCKKND